MDKYFQKDHLHPTAKAQIKLLGTMLPVVLESVVKEGEILLGSGEVSVK